MNGARMGEKRSMKAEGRDQFRGIFTALLTPMRDDGSIDYASLERLVESQIEQKIHGFYAGGSTGEGFLLTSEERMQLLEAVVQFVAGRVPIIAHIGCIGTMESIRLARHAENQGVAAVSAVVPFYYQLSGNEILAHYQAIMAAVSIPMIIYHYPGATGVQLTLDFYEQISSHPQCIGVKFTSHNLYEMQQIRARCGDSFLIFNGHDEIYASAALAGANGAIGSTFNMMPELFVNLHELLSREGGSSASELQSLQADANRVISHMLQYDVIPYEKYMLYLQGILSTPSVRQPLKRFTAEEKMELELFYRSNPTLCRQG
jgi:N-acetylneuraminate lyase